jgi:hypothetical protein
MKAAAMPSGPIIFLQMDWNGALQKRETAKKYRSMAQKI